MKEVYDLFGEALVAYLKGDRKNKFYFENSNGERYEQPLGPYLRKNKPFTKRERKMISQAHGNILDIGCGTGSFLPALMKQGQVLGIEISPKMIKICKNRGFENVKLVDIFRFKTKEKFDTIMFLDENIGLAETVPKTRKLLEVLSKLLTKNGQILADTGEVENKNYNTVELRCVWKNKKGPYFQWINFNSKFLAKLCNEQGLKMKIIQRDGPRYVARITKRR